MDLTYTAFLTLTDLEALLGTREGGVGFSDLEHLSILSSEDVSAALLDLQAQGFVDSNQHHGYTIYPSGREILKMGWPNARNLCNA